MNRGDIATEADIKVLVDRFYDKVVVDPVIGFIFTDVVQLSWETHIPIMYSFWSSLLLGAKSYTGNPMTKHIQLNKVIPLEAKHFDRWLELWEQTVHQNFEGNVAQDAITRAGHIARMMQLKISERYINLP